MSAKQLQAGFSMVQVSATWFRPDEPPGPSTRVPVLPRLPTMPSKGRSSSQSTSRRSPTIASSQPGPVRVTDSSVTPTHLWDAAARHSH